MLLAWKKHPERLDVKGIDTPKQKRKVVVISSGGKMKYPREREMNEFKIQFNPWYDKRKKYMIKGKVIKTHPKYGRLVQLILPKEALAKNVFGDKVIGIVDEAKEAIVSYFNKKYPGYKIQLIGTFESNNKWFYRLRIYK